MSETITPGSPAEILDYRRGTCQGCRYCGNRLTKTRVARGCCLRAGCKQAVKDGEAGRVVRVCVCEPFIAEHDSSTTKQES